MIVECGFCEAPTKVDNLDEHGFCKVCKRAFEVLTSEEIKEIQKKVGFKKGNARPGSVGRSKG